MEGKKSSRKQKQFSEDIMIGKRKIFIDLKKTKAHLKQTAAFNNLENIDDPDISCFTDSEELKNRQDLEFALRSVIDNSPSANTDDIDDYQKDIFLNASLKDFNINFDFGKDQSDDKSHIDLFSFDNPNLNNKSNSDDSKAGSTTGDSSSVLYDVNSIAHFVKYINRNGKIIRVWECGICSRDFQHQYTLMRHLPTHTNVRNFVCNECGKAFRQLSTLSQHKAIHSIERPYACETCNKSFNRISTLISHRKTHSHVKPFQCHMCLKGFHQKGNLRNHIYIHTNARPYRCPFCNKGFNQMSNLVCHKQKSHSSQLTPVWSCHRCPMNFPKRSLLRAHELETHHIQGTIKKSNKKYIYLNQDGESTRDALSNSMEGVTSSNPKLAENGILIPAIKTEAMKTARTNNEIPFAVLHFLEGLPLLVRIMDYENQSLLRAANKEDFAALKSQERGQNDKITVTIVAAVYQTLNAAGGPDFNVMPPKNIYKFSSNQQQMLTLQCDNDQINLDQMDAFVNNSTDMNSMLSLTPSQMVCNLADMDNFDVSSSAFENTLANIKTEINAIENDFLSTNLITDKTRMHDMMDSASGTSNDLVGGPVVADTFKNFNSHNFLMSKKDYKDNDNLFDDDDTSFLNFVNDSPDCSSSLDKDSLSTLIDAIKNDTMVPSYDFSDFFN